MPTERRTPSGRVAAGCLLVVALVSRSPAQSNGECAGYLAGQARNTCDAAIDGARVFTPVVGILMSGGNPALGATGGLGGFPHLGVTIRANATRIVVPDLDYDGTGRTVGAKQSVIAPAPLVEGALGISPGTGRGVLALDLLGSAQLLPTDVVQDVHIDRNATRIGNIALGLGVGARLTILPEGRIMPGIAVSLMHRGIPRVGVGSVAGGDQFAFIADMHVTGYRATAGKRLGPLTLGGGIGYDKYAGTVSVSFRDPFTGAAQSPPSLALSDSRNLAFVDAGVQLGPLYIVGEAGYLHGKDLGLGTTFTDNDPRDQRLFGSLGLRLGF